MPNSTNFTCLLLTLLTLHCDPVPAQTGPDAAPATSPGAAAQAIARVSLVAQEQQLVVDLEAPVATGQVQSWLFAGAIVVDQYEDLAAARASAGSVQHVLHGGVHARLPPVFKDVAPGAYTVCAQVGPVGVDAVLDWAPVPVRCKQVEVTGTADQVIVLQG